MGKRRRGENSERALAPLLPGLPRPLRYALGFGLMTLCLWLPAFIALFRR
ncbi:hypothetical protein [Rhodovarius lipocyclicus]|jgi:hypothetical protein|nr:hypothetical protein [Rhodovarius lipocyclicus]